MVYDTRSPYGSSGSSHVSFIAVELMTVEIKFDGAFPGSVQK